MRRREWTDPAPLEVARPRLPWWTLGPRWLLAIIGPVLALIVVIRVVVAVGRRIYRYPAAWLLLLVISTAVLMRWPWWPITFTTSLLASAGLL